MASDDDNTHVKSSLSVIHIAGAVMMVPSPVACLGS